MVDRLIEDKPIEATEGFSYDRTAKFDRKGVERPASERKTIFEWINESHPEWKNEIVRVVPDLYDGMARYFERTYGIKADKFEWGMFSVEPSTEVTAQTHMLSGEIFISSEKNFENVGDLIKALSHEFIHFFQQREEVELYIDEENDLIIEHRRGYINSVDERLISLFYSIEESVVDRLSNDMIHDLYPEYWIGGEVQSYIENAQITEAICRTLWRVNEDKFEVPNDIFELMVDGLFDPNKVQELEQELISVYGLEGILEISEWIGNKREGNYMTIDPDADMAEILHIIELPDGDLRKNLTDERKYFLLDGEKVLDVASEMDRKSEIENRLLLDGEYQRVRFVQALNDQGRRIKGKLAVIGLVA